MVKKMNPREANKATKGRKDRDDDFASVARELGCDEDKDRFERQLEKIAKAKVTAPIKGSRAR